ncbi:iron-sulfur cluster assembly protein [Thermorudis peleae]|uniref:iron-sulfur cluster assembly protein n=1 Tax=Thermorudis peleae TaxID=1382356 RepID=UPI00056E8C65|nr:iron-sulfur cluster assembly protein [Thermorudis peleae]
MPPSVAQIWQELDQVLDPELDQSITRLGFVTEATVQGSTVLVRLRLPTYWCSPNFAYLMADDARRRLERLPGVERVLVTLEDHFAAEAITHGVNARCAFSTIFPGEATDDLEDLRRFFLRKGFLSRQLVMVQALRHAGLSDAALCALRLRDLRHAAGQYWVDDQGEQRWVRPARAVERYLTRRREVIGDDGPEAWLLVDLDGRPLCPDRLSDYLRQIRATVVNLRASAALCEALLASRQQWGAITVKEAVQ